MHGSVVLIIWRPARGLMKVTLLLQRDNLLGEGPLWDDAGGRLYWVDIRARALECLTISSGRFARTVSNVPLTALGLRSSGGLIAAGDRSVGVVDARTGILEPRLTFEPELPRNRTNDGGVGRDGRFWFGTMDDGGEAGHGALYSVNADWTLKRAVDGLGIPNGVVTDERGAMLYMADSARQVIETRALDPTIGALSPPRQFVSFETEECTPDGAALDEEGCLWTALWDGARVVRIAPDGRIERSAPLPVARPTSCAFGGADLKTLYVTSAREGLDDAALADQPLAGSVFAIEAGVRGLPVPLFAG